MYIIVWSECNVCNVVSAVSNGVGKCSQYSVCNVM